MHSIFIFMPISHLLMMSISLSLSLSLLAPFSSAGHGDVGDRAAGTRRLCCHDDCPSRDKAAASEYVEEAIDCHEI